MPRNLFTLLFGVTFFVAIFMITHAQTRRPIIPTWRPNPPTRRPIIPTWRPNPPTRRPSIPTWRPNPPTRRPSIPTWRPNPPTKTPTRRPIPPTQRPTRRPSPPTKRPSIPTIRPTPPTWTVTLTITRKPRSLKRLIPRPCSKLPKCSTAGPSLCVRSRNGELCRRVANRCTLKKLNCRSKPRNNWIIKPNKYCGKLTVGARAAKCLV